ncbi:16S rRNA processing protein RimM [delta proteobacterium NaphS2]|nr:16S rRNA processing protein RimM [delta proteobacterium NaphS2]
MPDNVILFGRVLRPHGMEGLLRISSFSHSVASLLNAETVFLKLENGKSRHTKVISARPHKNIFLVKLAGLTNIDQAEALRGADIYISKSTLVRERDEYFWFELLGLSVFSDDGDFLGVVSQIIPAGSNEIYVVKNKEREILLPAAHEVVNHIDLKNGKMIVSPVEGLLDLNEV